MADADELRERKDQESESDQEKQDRIQGAIDAREHAEEYQSDSEEANKAADDAEAKIDNPDE